MNSNIEELQEFLSVMAWEVFGENEIEHGRQFIITDGASRCQVNFYSTGSIVVQGKNSTLKDELSEWANLQQSGIKESPRVHSDLQIRNRIAKYLVVPDNIENYRYEVRRDQHRVTITQYQSGTLMIQGLSNPIFDEICEALDVHLKQTFSARAARYIPGDEEERGRAESYLDRAESENEAATWLHKRIEPEVIKFCYQNDQYTLYAAAGVRNAIESMKLDLQDYSVVVMPFAKAYEGFLIRLSIHLGIADEDIVRTKASEIEIAFWIREIKRNIPDLRRYGEICTALQSAWQCRHKAIHSDPEHPYSILPTMVDAEAEISTILRAMRRAHRVFCQEELALSRKVNEPADTSELNKFVYKGVDRQALRDQLIKDNYRVVLQEEGKRNEWEILSTPELVVVAPAADPGLIVVEGEEAPIFISHYRRILENRPIVDKTPSSTKRQLWIGVDESGKGDLFGPLVIAGVVLTPDSEIVVAKHGVKDSKSLSDSRILDLSAVIRKFCEHEVIALLPPEYNHAYSEHNRNLNNLLAWGHAEIISRLHERTQAAVAVSDQFADESLVLRELKERNVTINLEQRPRAEDDLAVASASVLARAEFIKAIQEYTVKSGIEIPRGSSSPQVKQVANRIYSRWGEKGLKRICKMHFKTIKEMISTGAK